VLSVVVPIHDGADFVAACWETICRQSRRPDEVVFVDDGSNDGSAQRVRELPSAGIGCQLLCQACSGPAAARNAGVRAASGDVIAFLDVDDSWPERKLEMALAILAAHPEVCVVRGLVQIQCAGGVAALAAPLGSPHRRLNLGACVFRRRVFERCGLLDPSLRYGEDVEFFSRLHRAQVGFHELDEVALHYRRHAGNMTRDARATELGLFAALSKALASGRAAGSAKKGGPCE
jgi:glycosyltransferase involved in cell wall biosynthesis